jgi:DNA-binding transcriptional MocR family regulator
MPQTVNQLAQAWGVSRDTISRAIKRIVPHEGVLQSGDKKRGKRVYVSYRILDSALPAIREAMKKGRDTSKDKPRAAQPKARRSMLPNVSLFEASDGVMDYVSLFEASDVKDSLTYEAGIVLNGKDPYESSS